MATLRIDDLSLEIVYRDFADGWVVYNIWLRWKGEPVINDAILKRHNDYWANRGVGAIHANEYSGCGILPLLRHVLETNEPDYWEASDPDVLLALYPDGAFPFLPSKWQVVHERSEVKAKREAREREKAEKGKLPDDIIELMLFVDVYNFKNCWAYYGDGLCFRLSARRDRLEDFYQTLRAEYVELKRRHRIDEYNREHVGQEAKEEWF